jgi:Zn-dependent protease with chaperone function
MSSLVCPKERTLEKITLLFGIFFWLVLLAGTFGLILVGLLIGYGFYLFIQSTLISYIKGNGVRLTAQQFPDLHQQFLECCAKLDIQSSPALPEVYILHGSGVMNAFATRFLGAQYVVILSDVVDAMRANPDGVRFYLGHELGHLHRRHMGKMFLRWPALWIPLLGAAYARARETSCDRYGLACCASAENAGRALAALAAGRERWKDLDIGQFSEQARETSGFWMSFHELIAGYPWLIKRVARVTGHEVFIPRRSRFSYLLAACVPYAGPLGGFFAIFIYVYILVLVVALGVPMFKDNQSERQAAAMVEETLPSRNALAAAYLKQQDFPSSLESVHLAATLPNGDQLVYDPDTMNLTVLSTGKAIKFEPSEGDDKEVIWNCSAERGLTDEQLPESCRESSDSD